MKKTLTVLCLILALTLLVSCRNDDKPEQSTTTTTTGQQEEDGGITLDITSAIIGVGETKKLTAYNIATNSQTLNVIWTSGDSTVAAVDINGNVTGINDGSTVITAKTLDGKYEASCTVTVSSVVSGVTLDKESAELEVGESLKLSATVLPEGISNNGVTWFSSMPSVATVSDDGIVTAVGNGLTSIGVKTKDGEFSAFCTVTVVTYAKSITLENRSLTLAKGVSTTLNYTISPIDASNKDVTWSSDDTSVVTVVDGKITAVGSGVATVTVRTSNNCEASCVITVTSAVTGVSINHSVMTLNVGTMEQLIPVISPSDADTKTVTWSSSDPSVASVASGYVTAHSSGTATITVTTDDGGFTAVCEVTVIRPITSMSFENQNYSININNTVALILNKLPANADNETITYVSSDETIATVDENGVVTGTGHGSVTITATSQYGVSATCNVTVIDPAMIRVPVTSVKPSDEYVELYEGEKHLLHVTVIPENATDKTVRFVSSDEEIVTVGNDGTIVALKSGVARITIHAADNVKVTVLVSVTSLTEDEIRDKIADYREAQKLENERHQAKLDKLKADYDNSCRPYNAMLESLTINKEEYETKKAALTSRISELQQLINQANMNNDQQKVTEYALELTNCRNELETLESDYLTRLEVEARLAEYQSVYSTGLATENALHTNNMATIESDYQFIQKYLEEYEKEEEEDDTVTGPVSVGYAGADVTTNIGDYITFVDGTDNATTHSILFTANENVTQFKFLALDDSGDTMLVTEALYTVESFTPEKAFVAFTYINDATANRGISFVDSEGNTKYYYVFISMEDSAVTLVEFELAAQE